MPARFTSTAPSGLYGPGLIIDVIEITCAPEFDPNSRDAITDPETGDGQWFRCKHPNGVHLGTCRTPAELTARFGIDLASLVEVTRAARKAAA